MRARRQLMVLIWMAIVAIAVQVVPTAAQAHGGHTHGPAVAIEQPAATDPARSIAEHSGVAATAEKTEAIATAATTRTSSTSSGACHGNCCSTGFSCCVPALLAESPPYLPARMSACAAVRPATPLRAGIDPETLPKPPKSLS